MNPEAIRQALTTTKAELEARRDRIEQHTRHRDEPLPADFAEQASELGNADTLTALDAGITHELHQVELALQRLDAGTYGQCERCGAAISPARLAALPATTRCIDCAG